MPEIFGFSTPDSDLPPKQIIDKMSLVSQRHGTGERPFSALLDQAGIASTQADSTVVIDGSCLVAYSGHSHWSDPDLAKVAQEQGIARSISLAFQRHGPAFLERLQGPFSLAILIPREKRLFLAIDRIGIQPLAWARGGKGVVFASNAEVITAYPGFASTIDQQALFDYLYFHMIPSPGTIYSGVEKLLPAQCIDIQGNHIERSFYWSVKYQESSESPAHLKEELRAQLKQSVADAFDGRPTGCFLSGGLDSSTVSGYFAQVAEAPVDTYGIGFDAEGYDEMEFARASARHFGVNLHE